MSPNPPIQPEAVEVRFRQRVTEAVAADGPLTMRRALDLMAQFYQDTPIAGVDALDPDFDMLLFQ